MPITGTTKRCRPSSRAASARAIKSASRRTAMNEAGVWTVHIDGGSRGNPGPASYGFVLHPAGMSALEEKGYLGQTTNNFAEYTALIKALERAAAMGARRLHVLSDSELL